MSWSISFIGSPEKLARAVKEHGDTLLGEPKIEYDDALPIMLKLLAQNYGIEGTILKLTATGYGAIGIGGKPFRSMSVALEPVYSILA